MTERMYGVVLWADKQDSKAVIWCEDHGSLAFYSEPAAPVHRGFSLDAGDLIQFELRENRRGREACNLRRVDGCHARDLPARLRSCGQTGGAEVIPFPA